MLVDELLDDRWSQHVLVEHNLNFSELSDWQELSGGLGNFLDGLNGKLLGDLVDLLGVNSRKHEANRGQLEPLGHHLFLLDNLGLLFL